MPVKALYRINGGEVTKLRDTTRTFQQQIDEGFQEVLTDPTTPDGLDVVDESGDISGPLKELGFAKIAEPLLGPNGNVRNATAGEIAVFIQAEIDDGKAADLIQAKKQIDNNSLWRRWSKALLGLLIDENLESTNVKVNALTDEVTALKADLVASGNYNTFKAAAALHDPPASDLKETATLPNVVQALKNRMDANESTE
jgi:hypothetical protein